MDVPPPVIWNATAAAYAEKTPTDTVNTLCRWVVEKLQLGLQLQFLRRRRGVLPLITRRWLVWRDTKSIGCVLGLNATMVGWDVYHLQLLSSGNFEGAPCTSLLRTIYIIHQLPKIFPITTATPSDNGYWFIWTFQRKYICYHY